MLCPEALAGAPFSELDVAVPTGLVRAAGGGEAGGQRGASGAQRGACGAAEAERDGELLGARHAGERRLRRLHDVPGRRGRVGGVHAEVAQVLPAVAWRAEVAARRPDEARGADKSARDGAAGVAREQGVTARAAAVVHAVVAKARVVVGVEVELLAGERLKADVHEEDVPGRVGRVGLGHAKTAGLLVHLLVGQAARVEQPDAAIRGVAVPLGERLAVGDDEVERAHAGRAEVGIETSVRRPSSSVCHTLLAVPPMCRSHPCPPRSRAPRRPGRRAPSSRRRDRQGEQEQHRDDGRLHGVAGTRGAHHRTTHGTLIQRVSWSAQMRLLVVEDDVKMAALVRRGLIEEGAAVDVARTARTRSGWRRQRPTTRWCST